MVTKIKQWVSPPIFPDDETKTRRAEVVNIALLAVGGMGFFILLGNLVGGKTPWYVPMFL